MIIYLLVGLIGSGKSTWAKNKAKDGKIVIINRDAIREMIKGEYVFHTDYEPFVKAACYDLVTTALDYGFDIIIDETNISRPKRLAWLDLIYIASQDRQVEAKIIVVYFTEKEKNVENRMTAPKGQSREIWKTVYQKMLDNFEEPTLGEFPEGSEIIKVQV
jgi:predicted kinase